MKELIVIALGGAIGSVLRFILSVKIQSHIASQFPYGILCVNILGCLAMGFLSILLIERFLVDPLWRSAILIGVLGGFTTFSSFSIDTLSLIEQGLYLNACFYVLASFILCLLATGFGIFLGRML